MEGAYDTIFSDERFTAGRKFSIEACIKELNPLFLQRSEFQHQGISILRGQITERSAVAYFFGLWKNRIFKKLISKN